ncbi:MAG: LysE family translocator [Rhodobacteraceae bacterium]|nr:LysE family translocator [Paracoccaceae bacterium]
MPDLIVLLAFLPAALALNLTPGADMMFCLGQGLRSGPRGAAAASAGISAGAMVHVTVAGLGLGAVMARAPWAFDVIRWVGVAYLLYLAVQAFRDTEQGADAAPRSTKLAFRDGFMVNLSNPKVILFVLAFVPQFVDPDRAVLPQFLVFGVILALGGFVINAAVGAAASGAGHRLATDPAPRRWLMRLSGTIFGALALRLALLEKT